jgi:hypothetical protein
MRIEVMSINAAPYPIENSFFPEHLIIPLLTLLFFSIIVYIITRIKERQKEREKKEKEKKKENGDYERDAAPKESELFMKWLRKNLKVSEDEKFGLADMKTGDILSLVGLVGTIAIALVVPFSQLPILDYNVVGLSSSRIENAKDFYIVIHNFGNVEAENVLVSLEATNVKFLKFRTDPFLSKHFINNTTTKGAIIGKAVLEFDSLPPRSHTVITASMSKLSNSDSAPELKTHLRSDEAVGYHNTTWLVVFYLIMAGLFILFGISFSYSEPGVITNRSIVAMAIIFVS